MVCTLQIHHHVAVTTCHKYDVKMNVISCQRNKICLKKKKKVIHQNLSRQNHIPNGKICCYIYRWIPLHNNTENLHSTFYLSTSSSKLLIFSSLLTKVNSLKLSIFSLTQKSLSDLLKARKRIFQTWDWKLGGSSASQFCTGLYYFL